MKIGMTSLTLGGYTPAQVITVAKEAGIQGIEWGVSEGHMALKDAQRAQIIRKLSQESGIEIFSLGAYCYMEDREECDQVLETAVLLGAPVIRIWAGTKPPCECEESYKDLIAKNTFYMAERAVKRGIKLGFEYHPWTLTETAEDAVDLIKRVNHPSVALYWQPSGGLSIEKNVHNRNLVLPMCVGNIHVQNYSSTAGYGLLSEIRERLEVYFGDIRHEDYHVMIEFVKDGSVENLKADAAALQEIIGVSRRHE